MWGFEASLIILLILLLQGSILAKFEIFACGRKNKIGINDENLSAQIVLRKIVLDDVHKQSNLTAFTSSVRHTVFRTSNGYFFGFGDNTNSGRICKQLPATTLLYPIPLFIPDFDGVFLLEDYTVTTRNTFGTDPNELVVIKTIGYPAAFEDQLPAHANKNFWTRNFYHVNKQARPYDLRNPNGFIYPVSAQPNVDSKMMVEYGFNQGFNGNQLFKNFWQIQVLMNEYNFLQRIVKFQGLHNIFMALNEKGELYQWGFDQTGTYLGEMQIPPYMFFYDYLADTNNRKTPNWVTKPTRVFSNLGTKDEYSRFRNVITGRFSTVAITFDKKILVWGTNLFNMLGATNYNAAETNVFPARFADTSSTGAGWPSLEEIRQISVGDTHLLILKKDNTVWGIGSNINGEIGLNDVSYSNKFVKYQFPDATEQVCLSMGNCTIDFIRAGFETTFIGVNYNTNQPSSIQILPMCNLISHLDLNVCSGNGHCVANDLCSCFKGFRGKNCEIVNDCSKFNGCSNRGLCLDDGTCECFDYASGADCSIPTCGNPQNECSGNGRCAFKKGTFGSECICENGWNGTYCGNGPNSPILYACGDARFGQTGNGEVTGTVVEYKRVSFFFAEYNKDYRLTDVSAQVFQTSIIYGGRLFTLPTLYTLKMIYSVLGSDIDGLSSVPFLFPSKLRFKDFTAEKDAAAVTTDGKVFMLREINLGEGFSNEVNPYTAMDNVDKLYFTVRGTYFLKGGKVFERINNDFMQVSFPGIEGTDIIKCCAFTVGLLCLTSKGEAVQYKTEGTMMSNNTAIIFPQIGKVSDVECSAVAGALKDLKGNWYTFGQEFNCSLGRIDRAPCVDCKVDIGLATEFRIPGHKTIDISLGLYHSLVLSQEETYPYKKHLWAVGSNILGAFGWEGAPSQTCARVEVRLKPDIPIHRITKVLAAASNSFIGEWDDPFAKSSICGDYPSHLYDLVCNGHGDCLPNGRCKCKPKYKNYDDIHPYFTNAIDFFKNEPFRSMIATIGTNTSIFSPNNCIEEDKVFSFSVIILMIHVFWVSSSVILVLLFLLLVCALFCFFVFSGTTLCCGGCVGCLLCIVQGEKNEKKRQKNALLRQLLDKDSMEMEDDGKSKDFDPTLFNLDFNDFKILSEIGTGGSGALCLEAMDKKNDEKVFIKLFVLKKQDGGDEWDLSEFKNETQHLTRLRHTNIVTFYGLFFAPPSRVGYVCEFCQQGSLHSFLKKLRGPQREKATKIIKFDTRKKLDWLTQIAKGMRFLHQKSVIFRDLKPENVLIGKNEVLKITDFGISKTFNAEKSNSMTKQSGTSLYMAPEVVAGKQYGFEVDVFSYAILMYEVIFETVFPYGENAPFGIEFRVSLDPNLRPDVNLSTFDDQFQQKQVLDFDSNGNNNDSRNGKIGIMKKLVELMERCWDHEPSKRPSFRDIVNDLQQLEEEFEKLEEK